MKIPVFFIENLGIFCFFDAKLMIMENLITLPYAQDALMPVISAETLSFHHGKHLAAYVNNLNAAIRGTELEQLPLDELIRRSAGTDQTAVFNNAGQILNHNLYFQQFAPKPAKTEPDGALKAAVESAFGLADEFRKAFQAAGGSIFGSGWVWLQADAKGALSIGKYQGADNPVAHALKPLLTFDVWEHAYYLDYQNRRPDYLAALWSIVDWQVVESRYAK